jgi:AraC-like DNA-binding protein
LLSRRLEECKVALMNPIGGRSVTDIAFAWGFKSLATFHRNFRHAFGVTPGELRAETQTVADFGDASRMAATERRAGAAGREASPLPIH